MPARPPTTAALDGWEVLDRVIAGRPRICCPAAGSSSRSSRSSASRRAFARLEAVGLAPSIVAREMQGFPRIGYERLEHIRALDTEGTLPRPGMPDTVERLVIQGVRPE